MGIGFKMVLMGKRFRSDDLNQALLLPPSLHDWLPEKHLARFLVDVVETLDLGAIYASYDAKDGRGQAAYAPEMMLRLLLYGYCMGVYSSRKIEARTHEDVAFRFLSADQHPDHDTIADFRKRHLEALAGLFTQAWSSWGTWPSTGPRSRPTPASTRRRVMRGWERPSSG